MRVLELYGFEASVKSAGKIETETRVLSDELTDKALIAAAHEFMEDSRNQ